MYRIISHKLHQFILVLFAIWKIVVVVDVLQWTFSVVLHWRLPLKVCQEAFEALLDLRDVILAPSVSGSLYPLV